MTIPTEPIGSIPRPPDLIASVAAGDILDPNTDPMYQAAVQDTIERFEATGSPIISDGEQRKYHNFWTYSVHGLANTAPDGFKIPFAAGHTRRMPRLTRGPFRYRRYADSYLDVALRYAHRELKQAVISPSALSRHWRSLNLACACCSRSCSSHTMKAAAEQSLTSRHAPSCDPRGRVAARPGSTPAWWQMPWG